MRPGRERKGSRTSGERSGPSLKRRLDADPDDGDVWVARSSEPADEPDSDRWWWVDGRINQAYSSIPFVNKAAEERPRTSMFANSYESKMRRVAHLR